MSSFIHSGSFDKMISFLESMKDLDVRRLIEQYAQMGVYALADATPVDSGVAAASWGYRTIYDDDYIMITWTNDDVSNDFPVVIMLQYGYATGTGGYVEGQDFINPAIQPIFDSIADGVWKVVTAA
jgi:hypothetical protein